MELVPNEAQYYFVVLHIEHFLTRKKSKQNIDIICIP